MRRNEDGHLDPMITLVVTDCRFSDNVGNLEAGSSAGDGGSLIRGIDTDPPRQELLRALHAVAGKVGGQIIAEGIETSEELATLQGLGIPYGQGYLFGRAAPLRRSR